MARKTKEDTEQTRQAILDSALMTFYEKGFSRTTFDEIAKRINLTKGAVYWHFRNKTDLITALITQKISEQNKTYPDTLPDHIDELRQSFVSRAVCIENDIDFRRFLFFIIYRMEWSMPIFERVWSEIGALCELPEKKLYDALCQIQKNGEIKPDVNLTVLRDILICLWKGIIDSYISGCKLNRKLSALIADGFDAVINGVRTEKK